MKYNFPVMHEFKMLTKYRPGCIKRLFRPPRTFEKRNNKYICIIFDLSLIKQLQRELTLVEIVLYNELKQQKKKQKKM